MSVHDRLNSATTGPAPFTHPARQLTAAALAFEAWEIIWSSGSQQREPSECPCGHSPDDLTPAQQRVDSDSPSNVPLSGKIRKTNLRGVPQYGRHDIDTRRAILVRRENLGSQPRDELLTIDEVAQMLRVPVGTIRKWRSAREGPPAFRVGKYLRFRRSAVETYITERERAEDG
ncbi:helix-turn-helix domain-containing protein [Actinoplanes sp. NPDC051343]|uniref:helix-turn-helix domain-containing protein n=1 Tax=Actinoplanes sp. NPDC051343 TaxID=3363906 RepID=UPI0037B6C14C